VWAPALLLALLVPFVGLRAEEVPAPSVYVALSPAPTSTARLVWVSGTATAVGYWFSEGTILRADARLRYLEDKAATECFDKTVTADKKLLKSSWLPWVVGGLLGVGLGLWLRR
jgi:hypothetical protein